MPSLTSLLPWYWRWVMLAALISVSFTTGAALVYKQEERHHAKILADIQMAGEKQNVATETAIKTQKNITMDVARAFDSNVRSIDSYYNRRLRIANTNRRKMPAVSNSPIRHDASAADDSLTPEIIELQRDCAFTTAQLVNLQNWIRAQEQVK